MKDRLALIASVARLQNDVVWRGVRGIIMRECVTCRTLVLATSRGYVWIDSDGGFFCQDCELISSHVDAMRALVGLPV